VDNVANTANFTMDSPTVPVYVKYKKETTNHDSLAHLWNDWNRDYYDADFPRLMVRFEDVLFFAKNVTAQACACMGGTLLPKFQHIRKSAKKGKVHGQDKTTLLDSLLRYGPNHAKEQWLKGMTPEDLTFAKQVLDHEIMDTFGYEHPQSE